MKLLLQLTLFDDKNKPISYYASTSVLVKDLDPTETDAEFKRYVKGDIEGLAAVAEHHMEQSNDYVGPFKKGVV